MAGVQPATAEAHTRAAAASCPAHAGADLILCCLLPIAAAPQVNRDRCAGYPVRVASASATADWRFRHELLNLLLLQPPRVVARWLPDSVLPRCWLAFAEASRAPLTQRTDGSCLVRRSDREVPEDYHGACRRTACSCHPERARILHGSNRFRGSWHSPPLVYACRARASDLHQQGVDLAPGSLRS